MLQAEEGRNWTLAQTGALYIGHLWLRIAGKKWNAENKQENGGINKKAARIKTQILHVTDILFTVYSTLTFWSIWLPTWYFAFF